MRQGARDLRNKVKDLILKAESLKLKAFSSGFLLLFGLLFFFVFEQKADNSLIPVPVFGYKVINVFPHDPKAFTQGLVFHKGFLYEGTGLLGKSFLRKVELKTGKTLKQYRLPADFFGEGLTIWKSKIFQLTWRAGICFVYESNTFRLLKKFFYSTEGWGITHNGKQLIMSDGTDFLYFLDPQNFKEIKRIQVHERGLPVTLLNELEYIKGEIYANVYLTDRIVRISPETGLVTGWIDLTGILPAEDRTQGVDVLNGIAYDDQQDRLFVTGKYWPKLFEIQIVLSKK